jgi:HSF-type DNA-binding
MSVLDDSSSETQGVSRFLTSLFNLLDTADVKGIAHIISWQPHGRCFVVSKPNEFKSMLADVMPGMTRWKSFQRQLSLWGFKRLTSGRDANCYFHEYFLRHRPHLLKYMRRDRGGKSDGVQVNLDFYQMPFIGPLPPTFHDRNDDRASKCAGEWDARANTGTRMIEAHEVSRLLEPTPLPPLPFRGSRILREVDEFVPVSQHPCFRQIGPQEFVYCAPTEGGVDPRACALPSTGGCSDSVYARTRPVDPTGNSDLQIGQRTVFWRPSQATKGTDPKELKSKSHSGL